MSTPDFERLRAANAELERLGKSGQLTRPEYERIRGDARAAVGDATYLLESIIVAGKLYGVA